MGDGTLRLLTCGCQGQTFRTARPWLWEDQTIPSGSIPSVSLTAQRSFCSASEIALGRLDRYVSAHTAAFADQISNHPVLLSLLE
jgi:hypothetical protein